MFRFIRLVIAAFFMLFARLFKILCIVAAPSDLKEEFKDNI